MNLGVVGTCSASEFKSILTKNLSDSVEAGFKTNLDYLQKNLPEDYEGEKSIITIKLNPWDFTIFEDKYTHGKIRVIFTDLSGRLFKFLPITDLGFYDYAMHKNGIGELNSLNNFIQSQDSLFLRIGIGRPYDGKYWMQINGIYTFPEYLESIRAY